MRLPAYDRALALGRRLSVLSQDTGQATPFVLNDEQQDMLRAMLSHRRLVVVKGRQFGGSTVVVFFATLLAISNRDFPALIIADEQDKADGLLAKSRGWLQNIAALEGVAWKDFVRVDNARRLVLANGATIEAKTAISRAEEGEARTGRSRSYGFIHATEMAFWANARSVWAAATSTALSTARFVVESTGAPGGELFRALAEGGQPYVQGSQDDPDAYWRAFFGVEAHAAYRRDPQTITDAQWQELQDAHAFSRRDSAAWWYRKLHGDMRGDVHRCLREYPVQMHHAFVYASGRHIEQWTEVEVREEGPPDENGQRLWNHYTQPADEPVILGVDTASGVGKDSSAIAVVGHWTGKLHATYRCNTIEIPHFAQEVVRAMDRYKPTCTVIEVNGGYGAAVWSTVQEQQPRARLHPHQSGEYRGEVYDRRAKMKQSIENGEVPIGAHLIFEAKGSVIDQRHATPRFDGPDDVLSAVSFARVWRERNPDRQQVREPDPRNVYVPSRRKKRKARA